jgi:putative flippase GtrA
LIVRPIASRRRLIERGWRYTLIGLVCALLNYIIMLAVDFVGGHYLLGTVVSFVIVTPIGYALHSWFTFAEPFRLRAFVRFVGGVASAYPVAVALLALLCSGLRLSVAIAMPIVTGAMFAWNFGAAHWSILPRLGLSDARMETQVHNAADDVLSSTERG